MSNGFFARLDCLHLFTSRPRRSEDKQRREGSGMVSIVVGDGSRSDAPPPAIMGDSGRVAGALIGEGESGSAREESRDDSSQVPNREEAAAAPPLARVGRAVAFDAGSRAEAVAAPSGAGAAEGEHESDGGSDYSEGGEGEQAGVRDCIRSAVQATLVAPEGDGEEEQEEEGSVIVLTAQSTLDAAGGSDSSERDEGDAAAPGGDVALFSSDASAASGFGGVLADYFGGADNPRAAAAPEGDDDGEEEQKAGSVDRSDSDEEGDEEYVNLGHHDFHSVLGMGAAEGEPDGDAPAHVVVVIGDDDGEEEQESAGGSGSSEGDGEEKQESVAVDHLPDSDHVVVELTGDDGQQIEFAVRERSY